MPGSKPSSIWNTLTRATAAASAAFVAACAGPQTKHVEPRHEDVQREAATQRAMAATQQIPSGPVSPYINWPVDQRIGYIASRVMIAAAPYCGSDVRTTYNLQVGAPTGTSLVIMGRSGPLQPGDIITKVGNHPVGTGQQAAQTLVNVRSQAAAGKAPLPIEASRNGQTISTVLQPLQACNYPVNVVNNNTWNAFADGKSINLEAKLIQTVPNDDDLAFVMAHETAHNARRHMDAKMANARIGAGLGVLADIAVGVLSKGQINTQGAGAQIGMAKGATSYSPEFEYEADKFGMYITYGAGFDAAAGPRVAQMMGAKNPSMIERETTHPAPANRATVLNGVKQTMETQIRSGKPLRPE